MLMRASPVQGVVVDQQQQQQPPSSVMSTGSTFTAVTDKVDDKRTNLLLSPLSPPALDVPLPREVVHQFDNEDFEPNPVFNPSAPPALTSTSCTLPPPLHSSPTVLEPPSQYPSERLFPGYPPVPSNISFSVPPPPPPAPIPVVDRRTQFLVFVKILLKHLEKNAEDRIRLQAKKVLTECIAKNRQGDPDYTPLHLAAEARILPIVGPRHWNRCVQYLNLYLKKEAQKQQQQQQGGVGTAVPSGPVAI